MTDYMWRYLIWGTAIMVMVAHVFLLWDASNINDLKGRVEYLEAMK